SATAVKVACGPARAGFCDVRQNATNWMWVCRAWCAVGGNMYMRTAGWIISFRSFRYVVVFLGLIVAACGGNPQLAPDAGATEVTLMRIEVTPPSPRVPVGLTQQLAATGVYSDSTTKDLTAQVTWSSDAAAIATVSPAGVATAGSVGAAT